MAGSDLITGETQGLGLDLLGTTQSTQLRIVDTGTPANTGTFDPNSKFTYVATAPKLTRQSDGSFKWSNHNLNIQSQTLDNAAWTTNAATVSANSTTAPDGTSTADTVTLTGVGYFRATNTTSIFSGIPHVARVYAKKAAVKDWFVLSVFDSTTPTNGTQGFFDIVNGVTGTTIDYGTGWSTSSLSISDAGNGWWLCSLVFNPSAFTVVPLYHPGTASGDGTRASGDATYLWGAQIKRYPVVDGGALTDYVATTSSAVYLPAYEWDENGDPLGVLFEEERINLGRRSQEIDITTTAWTHSEVTVTANAATAPDGTSTADKVTPSTNATEHYVNNQTVTVTPEEYCTISIYAKAAGYSFITIDPRWPGVGDWFAYFDLSNGTVGSQGYAVYGLSEIDDCGNGWYRCICKFIANPTQTSMLPFIHVAQADAGDGIIPANYAGNGSNGVYLWGFQVEVGYGASSYIPTSGGSITRTANSYSLATSSMPYSATQGSLWARFVAKAHKDSTAKVLAAFHDGTADERISLEYITGEGRLRVVDGGTVQCVPGSKPGPQLRTVAGLAGRYKANDFAVVSNGDETVGIDLSGTLPTVTTFSLGYTGFIGHLQEVVYLPRTMNYQEMIDATTVDDVPPTAQEVTAVAINGCSDPIYGSVTENAVYDSSVDKTLFAWEGYDGNRKAFVASYSHVTGDASTAVSVGFSPLTDDDHGVPAIVKDDEGYWHAFGGAHNSALQHSVTNAANDISAWTLQTNISGEHGYPKPCLVGDALYIFSRTGAGSNFVLQKTATTALVAGAATWGSSVEIIHLESGGTEGRVLAGNARVVGTEIWFPVCRGLAIDTARVDIYFFRYLTTTGAIKNYDGSVTVASGSLPITKSTADTSFRVYQHTGANEGIDVPQFVLDGSNVPYVFYASGEEGVTPFSIFMTYPSGGSWTVEDTGADCTNRYDVIAPVRNASNGVIDLYYPSVSWPTDWGSADAYIVGGNLARVRRSAGGVWGSPEVLLTPIHRAIGRVTAVLNGHEDAQIFMAESAVISEALNDSGNMRVFLYGNEGFVSPGSGLAQAKFIIPDPAGSYELTGANTTLTKTTPPAGNAYFLCAGFERVSR